MKDLGQGFRLCAKHGVQRGTKQVRVWTEHLASEESGAGHILAVFSGMFCFVGGSCRFLMLRPATHQSAGRAFERVACMLGMGTSEWRKETGHHETCKLAGEGVIFRRGGVIPDPTSPAWTFRLMLKRGCASNRCPIFVGALPACDEALSVFEKPFGN